MPNVFVLRLWIILGSEIYMGMNIVQRNDLYFVGQAAHRHYQESCLPSFSIHHFC